VAQSRIQSLVNTFMLPFNYPMMDRQVGAPADKGIGNEDRWIRLVAYIKLDIINVVFQIL